MLEKGDKLGRDLRRAISFGNVVEWSMAAVLNTADPQGSVSSNLTVSAKLTSRGPGLSRLVNINPGRFRNNGAPSSREIVKLCCYNESKRTSRGRPNSYLLAALQEQSEIAKQRPPLHWIRPSSAKTRGR